MNKLLFTKSALPFIFEALNYSINSDGFIEDANGNIIMTADGESITADEFGGMRKTDNGINYYKSGLYSAMKMADETF